MTRITVVVFYIIPGWRSTMLKIYPSAVCVCYNKSSLSSSTEWMGGWWPDTRKKHELLFGEIKYELNVIWQSRRVRRMPHIATRTKVGFVKIIVDTRISCSVLFFFFSLLDRHYYLQACSSVGDQAADHLHLGPLGRGLLPPGQLPHLHHWEGDRGGGQGRVRRWGADCRGDHHTSTAKERF